MTTDQPQAPEPQSLQTKLIALRMGRAAEFRQQLDLMLLRSLVRDNEQH